MKKTTMKTIVIGSVVISGSVFTAKVRGYQVEITVDGKAFYVNHQQEHLAQNGLVKIAKLYPFIKI